MNPSAPAPSPAEPAKGLSFAPEVFGKYFLVDKIAMGGMAEIFKAKTFGHGGFENLVVIKRILAHLSANDQFVRMFMDEAKVCALLQNANIVRIYDFGKLRENYFIAMECVEGKDVKLILRKLAERRKLLPREFAVYIAMEAAKGLDYAHKRTTLQGQPLSIVHRDVSPSNILVSYNGEVKVADFGIVKAANCAEDTDAGMLKGKFEYMSPEQASGTELDRRSDIFSLGIILHEMLTGRRLFKTDDEIRTLERIKKGDIDPPSAVNPAIPARLDDIVMQALARDPADRYQDARELHAALLEFLYPASPDLTQQSLAHFMADLFSEETAAERDRLQEGSRLALALHESQAVELDPEWEEESPSSRTHPTAGGTAKGAASPAPASPSRLPWIAACVALLFGFGTTAFFLLLPADPPAEVGVAARTSGTIQLRIGPVAGRVFVDGVLSSEGAEVTIGEVSPGAEHTLRVEAEGYTAFEEKVTVEAGERVRLLATLVAIPVAPTEQAKAEPVPGAPSGVNVAIAGFTSAPPGAEVYVEGKLVGRTPFEWDDGVAGKRYSVEFRLAGHESARFSVSLPQEGGRESHERTLPERIKAEGKLSTNVSPGWADIYVDGKKIGTTPIFNFALPAGTHEVRARRDDIGLDQTKQVTIRAGETTTLPFSAN